MAEIVSGMAVPHSGMLGKAPAGRPEDGTQGCIGTNGVPA
jgi:hypothetical protein